MSAAPSEAEILTQWRAVIDLFETFRVHADATVLAGGNLDVIEQATEGVYTPVALSDACSRFREALSDLISPERVRSFVEPILLEYARVLGAGSGFTDTDDLMRSLYEYYVANTKTVESRAITFDVTPNYGGSNVGNAQLGRLVKDENDFALENVNVETKYFRCRSDQNTGTDELAESWECIGQVAAPDNMLLHSDGTSPVYGSGEESRTFITNRNAGTGSGGSLLRNSSFSTYDAAATPDFSGWDLVSGTQPTQDTANYYLSHPRASTDASMKFTTAARVKQTLTNMRISELDVDTPYFLRIMVNKTIGSGSGGTFQLHCGSEEYSIAVSSIGANWQEIIMPFDKGCWPRQFNQDGFDIDIEWHDGGGSVSGYMLVDDAIFAPWDEIDGSYWILRHNQTSPVPSLVDDTINTVDTGGLAPTAKIQYWLWQSGMGYLPHTTCTPSFTEPS